MDLYASRYIDRSNQRPRSPCGVSTVEKWSRLLSIEEAKNEEEEEQESRHDATPQMPVTPPIKYRRDPV